MQRTRFFAVAALSVLAIDAADITPQAYLEHVKYLSSDKLKGRATGSPELEKAAAYIAKQFKQAGLQPIDGKSYYQSFSVTTNAKLGSPNQFDTRSPARPLH